MIFIKVKNTGKGFLTAENRLAFNINNLFEDYWILENSPEAIQWALEQKATRITKANMRDIYIAWRNDPANVDPETGDKPTVTIPDSFRKKTGAEKERARRSIRR